MSRKNIATPSRYWWSNDPGERFWVEIRWEAGIGMQLRCPLVDRTGHSNPWYDLVDDVKEGDVVFHWHAHQQEFVGRSVVASTAHIVNQDRIVRLHNFRADTNVKLADVRKKTPELQP